MDRYDFEAFYLFRERYLEEQDYWPSQIVAALQNQYRSRQNLVQPKELIRYKPTEAASRTQPSNTLSPLAIAMMSHGLMPDPD